MTYGRFCIYNKLFSVSIVATAYSFALTGGSFAFLVPFQAIVLVIPSLSLITPGYKDFNVVNLIRWSSISTIVLLSVLFNINNYPSGSTTIEFALAHAAGIVGILFALQWAATNLSPETLMRHLSVLLVPLILLAVAVALPLATN